MIEENKPFLIINKEYDEIQINIKHTKPYLNLQQENKQLKEELQKADSITQSCIFEGKEESTINFRECLNTLDLYKEVIEEAREYIKDSCYYPELENYSNMTSEEVKELLQILDKVKESK